MRVWRLMCLLCASGWGGAQTPHLTIDAGTPVSTVSSTLYGLMTEEINFSYDGGLYAEIVRNRTFSTSWPQFGRAVRVRSSNLLSSARPPKDGSRWLV